MQRNRSREVGYIVGQIALLVLLLLAPPIGAFRVPRVVGLLGLFLITVGLLGALVSAKTMGPSLTPHPAPRKQGTLLTSGIFARVRHPIYSCLLIIALGFVLIAPSLLRFALFVCFVVLLIRKSKLEEGLLRERFSDYDAYAQRTPRFLPRLPVRSAK